MSDWLTAFIKLNWLFRTVRSLSKKTSFPLSAADPIIEALLATAESNKVATAQQNGPMWPGMARILIECINTDIAGINRAEEGRDDSCLGGTGFGGGSIDMWPH